MPNKERIKTGIPGLDEIISGGLSPKSLTLLTGTTGTGKTIMSSQFIFNGLKDFNQSAVYVSFEEPLEAIKENSLNFGWDFSNYEKKEKVIFVRYDPFHVEDIYELIETNVKKINAERVVIDSVSALGLYVRDAPEIRRMIFNIAYLLRKLNCTTILVSEILPMQESLSRFGVEEFVTDGVIVLYYTRVGSQFSRSLTVWKMRDTDHSNKIHPYRITSKGVVIYPKEEAYVK
jgi:KaiC/GvpD/RAD55 family RecA-like ATPase